jgi:hypothetical protein
MLKRMVCPRCWYWLFYSERWLTWRCPRCHYNTRTGLKG